MPARKPGSGPSSAAAADAAARRPSRIAARSRGPPRPRDSRARARAMSGAPLSAARKRASGGGLAISQDQPSCRAEIAAMSANGADTHSASSRAPAAVEVRWIAASSVCAVPPSRARVISRLARVAASISSRPASPRGNGRDRRGILPAWVSRT